MVVCLVIWLYVLLYGCMFCERIILKLVSNKWGVREWIKFVRLRIQTTGEMSWIQQQTFGFHKVRRKLLADRPQVSQQGLRLTGFESKRTHSPGTPKPTHSLTHSLHTAQSLTHSLHTTQSLTHSLTPHSTVLLEKLTGFQLVKKLPAIYVTRRFITAFTSARHLSLP
jgi:hypothetical protein